MPGYVLDLLDFALGKLAEARTDQAGRKACMTEAFGAISVLMNRLLFPDYEPENAQELGHTFVLFKFKTSDHPDLVELSAKNDEEFDESCQKWAEKFLVAKLLVRERYFTEGEP